MARGRKIRDLTGQIFGTWKVLRICENRPHHLAKKNSAYWYCECMDCGSIHIIRSDSLTREESHRCKKCAAIERMYG